MICCPLCRTGLVLVDEDGLPLSGMEELYCRCGAVSYSAMNRLPPRPGETPELQQWRFTRHHENYVDRTVLVLEDGRLFKKDAGRGLMEYDEIKAPRRKLRAFAELVAAIEVSLVLTS